MLLVSLVKQSLRWNSVLCLPKERGPMPRTHAGYRGVRWHVVEFLIDLQGPAPPGTVGYTENLAKAGSG